MRTIPHYDDDFVARAQISANLSYGQNFAPRTLPTVLFIRQNQAPLARAMGGYIICRTGIGELTFACITDRAPRNSNAACIINPKGPNNIFKSKCLIGAHLNGIQWVQRCTPQDCRIL